MESRERKLEYAAKKAVRDLACRALYRRTHFPFCSIKGQAQGGKRQSRYTHTCARRRGAGTTAFHARLAFYCRVISLMTSRSNRYSCQSCPRRSRALPKITSRENRRHLAGSSYMDCIVYGCTFHIRSRCLPGYVSNIDLSDIERVVRRVSSLDLSS